MAALSQAAYIERRRALFQDIMDVEARVLHPFMSSRRGDELVYMLTTLRTIILISGEDRG